MPSSSHQTQNPKPMPDTDEFHPSSLRPVDSYRNTQRQWAWTTFFALWAMTPQYPICIIDTLQYYIYRILHSALTRLTRSMMQVAGWLAL